MTEKQINQLTEYKLILVEWIDKKGLYHSGIYPIEDKKEIEIKLNEWLNKSLIKSYDITKYDGVIGV